MSAPPPAVEPTENVVKQEVIQVKGLPPGWRREVVVRKNGLSAGKTDVYYYSPCGKKFRSKPQIARFLGECVDLACFDFSRAGTPGDGTQRRRARDRSAKRVIDLARPTPLVRPLSINPLRPSGPIRRTCGVIKLPVTWVMPPNDHDLQLKNSQLSVMTPEAKLYQQQQQQGNGGLAVQASWERKLIGVKAYDYESGSEIELSPKPLLNGVAETAMELAQPTLKPNGALNPEPLNLPHHQNGGSQIRSSSPSTSLLASGAGNLLKQHHQQPSLSHHQQPQASVMDSLIPLSNLSSSNTGSTVPSHLSGRELILLSLKQRGVLSSQVNRPSAATTDPPGGGVVPPVMVTDKDLRLQEEKVRLIRRQLMAVQGTS